MKAIIVKNGRLIWDEAPEPVCGDWEVVIQVAASAVNRADLLQAEGKYPPPPGASSILGLEAAGTVVQAGKFVNRNLLGKRVCTLLSGGGYAERVVAAVSMLLEVPEKMDFKCAAAVPEAWYTAYLNLLVEGGLKAGDKVLIHAGASGVGTAAIQICNYYGASAFVTVSSEEKAARCLQLGAKLAINYKIRNFAAELQAALGDEQIDLVLDPVGAKYLDEHLTLLREDGTIICIGLMGGSKAEINLAKLLQKRIKLKGSTLRNRRAAEKTQLTDSFRSAIWPAFKNGMLKPVVDYCFPMEEAEAAHVYVKANKNVGKVVLEVSR